MSLKSYLIIAYTLIVTFLLLTIFFVIRQMNKIEKSYAIELEASAELENLKNIKFEFEDLRRNMRLLVILAEPVEREKLEASSERIKNYILKGRIADSKLKELFDHILETKNKVYKYEKAASQSVYLNEFLPLEDKFLAGIDSQIEKLTTTLNDIKITMNATRTNIHRYTIIFFFLISVLLVSAMIAFYRFISKPLFTLISAIRNFAKGGYSKIVLTGPAEIRLVGDTFNLMQDEIIKLEKQVVQLERLSVVGQLAGGVAHEINNPLQSVLGYTQMVMSKLPEADPRKEQLKRIEQSARRCANIVKALLDFSKSTEYKFELKNIVDVIETALDFVNTEIKKYGIEVEKIYNYNDKVFVSQSHMEQAFLNILSNSINALENSAVKKITIKTYMDGNMVAVEFKDTGSGIKEEDLPKVFEPFFTTRSPKGTGLGLSITYRIIQNHKGKIDIKSEYGKWTAVKVLLPHV